MSDLRIAVVGCGRIGVRHAEHAASVGTLVAVCDNVDDKATTMAAKMNCNSYGSIEDLLANEARVDVVAVCTPNGLHAEHAIKSLAAGSHVLCEKPMAIRVRDCIDMIKAAEAHNRRLFIVKQNRYNPPVVAVRDLIERGKLGRICSVHLNCFWNRNPAYFENSWKGSLDLDGGILFTQFSHFVDLLYWLIGDVVDVHAFADNTIHKGLIEFEDQLTAVLKFASGAIGTASFTINACKKNMEGSLTIFGEKGTVKIGGQYLNELEYQMIEGFEIEDLPQGNPPNLYGDYVGSMSNHDKVYQNLVDVLRGGGSIGTIGIEGMKTVEIIEAIYASAARQRP
jgi:predicted dehydrogenase